MTHSIFINSHNKNTNNTERSLRLPSFSQIEKESLQSHKMQKNLDDSFLIKPTLSLNQQHNGNVFNNKEHQRSINEPRKSAFTPYFSLPPISPLSPNTNNSNYSRNQEYQISPSISWFPRMKNSNSSLNHLGFLPSVPLITKTSSYPFRNEFQAKPESRLFSV
ncbi:13557_t:CDS:2 [Ambispora leptoticha]|uniref:13557_t:CDS:1 n=1 Tax=Ambispora leptoticha TaxID=144679 RepID=A0A9N8WBB9_9GLOM|nr:13557_t:CDS:2 [Ambispora leptoticha]